MICKGWGNDQTTQGGWVGKVSGVTVREYIIEIEICRREKGMEYTKDSAE